MNLTAAAGSTVYVKWNASTTGTFGVTPISIYYTTDDTNYTLVAAGLANAQGAGCTIGGSETGCYAWTNGAPVSTYFRVRVGAIDANSRQSYQSTQPMNVDSTLKILAGATDPGTNGSADAAVFTTAGLSSGWQEPGLFVVTTAGVVYFADSVRGILKVDPSTGSQQLLLPKTGAFTEGAVPGATVKDVVRLALDSQGRILLFDYDRIRRYDPSASTLTTIIGGGASTAATVAPLSLKLSSQTASNIYPILFYAAADGKIYFQAENYAYTTIGTNYVMRVYDPGANQVTSRTFSGTGDAYSASQDITLCGSYGMGATWDPVTGTLTKIILESTYGYAGCDDGSDHFPFISIDPATNQSAGPHPAGTSYSQYFTYGGDGRLFSVDRISALVKVYVPGTNSFATILGTGTSGVCADGTAATSCTVDVSDFYADQNGKYYFLERGKIRTIDQSNAVRTVMGSGFTTGDGGPATSARMGFVNEVRLWNDGANDKVVLGDGSEYRLREFDVAGNIMTIAGNGNNGVPSTASAAAGQPIQYNSNSMNMPIRLQVDATNGTIYSSLRSRTRISKLDRTTGKWVDLVGNGAGTDWDLPAADGKLGNQINLNGYASIVAAFDGTHLFDFLNVYNGSSMVKLHSVSDGTQTAVIGAQGYANTANDYSVDGTAGIASTVPWSASAGIQSAIWDSFGSRWVFNNAYTSKNDIRTITVGGNLGTVATIPSAPSSFTYRHDASHDVIYYCRSSNHKLYKYDVTTSTNTALTWPIAKMQCQGTGMVYSASRNSIVFPFTQDGLGGVAEYLNP